MENGWAMPRADAGFFAGKGSQGLKQMRVSDDGSQVAVDRYSELALRGQVFIATRAAITVPVNANNLVSVMSLYNPASSGVFLDIFEASLHEVLATTVVDIAGLYFQGPALSASATFTTLDTTDVQNARLGEGASNAGRLYSALTHSGTPILAGLIGGWGAVTDGAIGEAYRFFGGKLLLPPGCIASLAMTTAASTGSGITAELKWAEIPYSAI